METAHGRGGSEIGNFTGNVRIEIAGRREQFAGLLQERFGYTREDEIGPLDEYVREVEL